MRPFDVAVVGGGPIGAVAARAAAEGGARVLLVERRAATSGPAACTGLISPRSLSLLGATDAAVLRDVSSVIVYGPRGTSVEIASSHRKAVVVDRPTLERQLLARAADAGVDVRLGATAVGLAGESLRVRTQGREVIEPFRVLIGADGPRSAVAAWCGAPPEEAVVHAVQVELHADVADDEPIAVFLGRSVAPGFFAWKVPAEPDRLRVGLGVCGNAEPGPYLTRLLATRFPSARVVSEIEADIPYPSLQRSFAGAALLVGDAAGHVKPLSGGGLYFGALCARRAGRLAAAAAEPGTRQDTPRAYAAACQTLIGGELRFGLAARARLAELADAEIDALLGSLNDPALRTLVADHGDIDYVSRIVPRIAAHPRSWPSLWRVLTVLRSVLPSGDDGASAVTKPDVSL